MRARRCFLAVLVSLVVLGYAPARAAWFPFPAELGPGDQFRAVFVSSAVRDARSSDIGDYDQFITDLATTAGLNMFYGSPVTWQVIGSTATVAAIDRLPQSLGDPPMYRMDGGLVARSDVSLWTLEGVFSTLSINELGAAIPPSAVWTGTTSRGMASVAPLGHPTQTVYGLSVMQTSGWIAYNIMNNYDTYPGEANHRFYGVSSVLTVPASPVPEPASAVLVLVGLGGLAGLRTARRKPQPHR